MSRKSWGFVLGVAGLALILLAVFADGAGIGGTPGFGFAQIAALVVGIGLIIAGVYLVFKSESQPAKPAAEPRAADTPVAQAAPSASGGQQDDLTRLEGIGPTLQTVLYAAGYGTYNALASATPDAITRAVKEGGFKAPFDAASWPEQASLAAKGDWSALEKLQSSLTAGRK